MFKVLKKYQELKITNRLVLFSAVAKVWELCILIQELIISVIIKKKKKKIVLLTHTLSSWRSHRRSWGYTCEPAEGNHTGSPCFYSVSPRQHLQSPELLTVSSSTPETQRSHRQLLCSTGFSDEYKDFYGALRSAPFSFVPHQFVFFPCVVLSSYCIIVKQAKVHRLAGLFLLHCLMSAAHTLHDTMKRGGEMPHWNLRQM